MAEVLSGLLLRAEFLPLRNVPVKVSVRGSHSWRDAFLREDGNNGVTWEIWHKNSVCMRGIEPGDRWMPYHGGSVTTVEVYLPAEAVK